MLLLYESKIHQNEFQANKNDNRKKGKVHGTQSAKSPITHVLYSYVGTGAQFDEFLKLMLHDYLAADNPYANRHQDFC